MKRPYYIFSAGRLRRKDNSLSFEPHSEPTSPPADASDFEIGSDDTPEPSAQSRNIPIESVDSFLLLGEISLNTRLLNFLSSEHIPAHYFNYYGHYAGSFYPRDYLLSGYLLLRQARLASRADARLDIARRFLEGGAFNLLKNLKYYESRLGVLKDAVSHIEQAITTLQHAPDVPSLMGIEGNIRKEYYAAIPYIIGPEFEFHGRQMHPPSNPVNALISFGNSLVYTTCVSELYRTQLSPVISFLHEPGERRFSLALDIAEIFKPFLSDRITFKVLNQGMIQAKHFESGLGGCFLTAAGRKIFAQEYENRLQTTIMHRGLKRKISYRRLVRLECYKLVKHILGESSYEPFKVWW